MVETAHARPLHHEQLSRPQLAGPLYFQIQQLLRARILSKEWADGRALPNETDLARSYGVSVGTMRKALDLLAQSKVIVRRQGLGTAPGHRRERHRQGAGRARLPSRQRCARRADRRQLRRHPGRRRRAPAFRRAQGRLLRRRSRRRGLLHRRRGRHPVPR